MAKKDKPRKEQKKPKTPKKPQPEYPGPVRIPATPGGPKKPV